MNDALTPLLASLCQQFEAWSAAKPAWAASAPGRVNLIGDHTDYSQGFALPMGIDLYTLALAAPRLADADGDKTADSIRIYSTSHGETRLSVCDENPPVGDWTDYLRGVLRQYRQRNIAVPAMDIIIGGNLPLGAGLSSSASLELCFATLMELASAHGLAPLERALLCQQAEHDYAGVPCGILDQFAVTFAKEQQAMLLDCRRQSIKPVPLPAHVRIAIVDSGVSHALADGGYAKRRAEVESAEKMLGKSLRDANLAELSKIDDPVIKARTRHVLSENQRVHAFAAALAGDDVAAAGQLMFLSHNSLSQDFAVSCIELDTLVSAAKQAGAIGARMTGGGFGGSMVALVRAPESTAFEGIVNTRFTDAGFAPATVRWVNAVAGARAWNWTSP
ncbi:MAG: galactokinase [Congregibacter sp.]|nr:galactokinase [Congregibacter sp.]MDP5071862.1 galactokinase [Congregibacter sp.]